MSRHFNSPERNSMPDLKAFIPMPDLFSFKSVLCVQPHPDDNEIGAGGTIAKLCQAGLHVTYLTVSQGKGGSNTLSSKALVEQRQTELKTSGHLLGVQTFYQLDLEDAHYPDEKELCQKMVEIIRNVKPEVVMSVDPYLLYEAHPTHRKTGIAVLEACLFAALKHFPNPDQENSLAHHVQAVAFYGSAHPNTILDISSTFELKLKAIQAHRSQFDEVSFGRLKQYLSLKAQLFGQEKNVSYAEAFKVLPMVLTHMMVESETY